MRATPCCGSLGLPGRCAYTVLGHPPHVCRRSTRSRRGGAGEQAWAASQVWKEPLNGRRRRGRRLDSEMCRSDVCVCVCGRARRASGRFARVGWWVHPVRACDCLRTCWPILCGTQPQTRWMVLCALATPSDCTYVSCFVRSPTLHIFVIRASVHCMYHDRVSRMTMPHKHPCAHIVCVCTHIHERNGCT